MAKFAQLIEFKSSRIDDMQKLNDEWRERYPDMGPLRVIVLADRNNPGTFIGLAEFESPEHAAKNSADPATDEYAAKMAELSDGPPTFRDFDVIREETRA